MAKRKEFAGIVNSVVSSFVSRNNDLEGYWALGRLYKLALECGANAVSLDLFSGRMTPSWSLGTVVTEAYRNMLLSLTAKAGIPNEYVSSAEIAIVFGERPGVAETPFVCRLSVVDDRGRLYVGVATGSCRAHDPRRELRSTRASSIR